MDRPPGGLQPGDVAHVITKRIDVNPSGLIESAAREHEFAAKQPLNQRVKAHSTEIFLISGLQCAFLFVLAIGSSVVLQLADTESCHQPVKEFVFGATALGYVFVAWFMVVLFDLVPANLQPHMALFWVWVVLGSISLIWFSLGAYWVIEGKSCLDDTRILYLLAVAMVAAFFVALAWLLLWLGSVALRSCCGPPKILTSFPPEEDPPAMLALERRLREEREAKELADKHEDLLTEAKRLAEKWEMDRSKNVQEVQLKAKEQIKRLEDELAAQSKQTEAIQAELAKAQLEKKTLEEKESTTSSSAKELEVRVAEWSRKVEQEQREKDELKKRLEKALEEAEDRDKELNRVREQKAAGTENAAGADSGTELQQKLSREAQARKELEERLEAERKLREEEEKALQRLQAKLQEKESELAALTTGGVTPGSLQRNLDAPPNSMLPPRSPVNPSRRRRKARQDGSHSGHRYADNTEQAATITVHENALAAKVPARRAMCHRCDLFPSVVYCTFCEVYFCDHCNTFMHKKGSMVAHQRVAVVLELPKASDNVACFRCSETPAALRCQECNSCFCEDCDSVLHKSRRKRGHARTPLLSAASAHRAAGAAPAPQPHSPGVDDDALPTAAGLPVIRMGDTEERRRQRQRRRRRRQRQRPPPSFPHTLPARQSMGASLGTPGGVAGSRQLPPLRGIRPALSARGGTARWGQPLSATTALRPVVDNGAGLGSPLAQGTVLAPVRKRSAVRATALSGGSPSLPTAVRSPSSKPKQNVAEPAGTQSVTRNAKQAEEQAKGPDNHKKKKKKKASASEDEDEFSI